MARERGLSVRTLFAVGLSVAVVGFFLLFLPVRESERAGEEELMLDEDGFLPAVEYFLPYSSGVEDAQGRRVGGAVLVSYEWPSEDFSRQESRYLDDDVPWHPQIEVGKASSLVVVSPVAPFNCEFWVYSKRDREGIPIGEPVDSGSCRYSFKSGDAGILNVAIPEIYSSASLAVLQLEWSGLFETAPDRIFSARMSWAVQFE